MATVGFKGLIVCTMLSVQYVSWLMDLLCSGRLLIIRELEGPNSLVIHCLRKKTCDYVFYNNLNNQCPITIILASGIYHQSSWNWIVNNIWNTDTLSGEQELDILYSRPTVIYQLTVSQT